MSRRSVVGKTFRAAVVPLHFCYMYCTSPLFIFVTTVGRRTFQIEIETIRPILAVPMQLFACFKVERDLGLRVNASRVERRITTF